MGYRASILESIGEVPPGDWPEASGVHVDLAMDRRLLAAFEQTMRHECRCWFIVVRDERDRPAGWVCACHFEVDGAETTGPAWQSMTRAVRRMYSGFMRFGVVFCGLPVPGGHSHIRFSPEADKAAVIAAVDEALRRLARQTHARLVVWREFDAETRDALRAPLEQAGYVCGEVPCAHVLEGAFSGIEAYTEALRSGYRRQLGASQEKFAKAGGLMITLTGAAAAEAFDEGLHALYLAVRNRAEYRMETLPAGFFRDTARRFDGHASLTIARRGGRPAGFAFGIASGSTYHNLYVGLDYAVNAEAEVYFNLYYHDLDQAFRRGCTRLELGQTSDEFKTRLGSRPRPLWFFVRAGGSMMNAGLRASARWMFPPVQKVEIRQVFKANGAERRNPPEDESRRQSPPERKKSRAHRA